MKKGILISLIAIAVLVISLIVYSAASESDTSVKLMSEVVEGNFEIIVNVTGELKAEKSVEIKAPAKLRSRNLRIRTIKIQALVPEGTVVDSGDWVATLDRSEADNTLKDILDGLEKDESAYTKSRLDTTIQLRQLRDDLINLRFNMEEQGIALEQSQYEPPATIRQAQINLDKATRAFEQASKNYFLKEQQAKADMISVKINVDRQLRTRDEMITVLEDFDIYAPAPGMVIYKKDWSGQERTVGSEINTWDLTVATLPDLATLVSITYVNEIDISKIKVGQEVRVGVDAFPEKLFIGSVITVANIGEQLPNTDAKVFEVLIRLNSSDPVLRPSMTTSNQIVISTFPEVMHIPIEALHANDSVSFVYRSNHSRQIVIVGESNENSVVINQGLEIGEKIFLNIPEDPESFKFQGLELMEIIKEMKAEEEKAKAEAEAQQKLKESQRPKRPGAGNFGGRKRPSN